MISSPLVIPLADLPADFRVRALHWGAQFPLCTYFEHNDLTYPQGPFRRLLAVAPAEATTVDSLAELGCTTAAPALRCGFISYDVKNDIEALSSQNFNGMDWPELSFFVPQIWLIWQSETIEIHGLTANVLNQILAYPIPVSSAPQVPVLRPRMGRADYLRAVEAIRTDILNGEVYELNLCQEFYAENVALPPVDTFWRLMAASPAPFAGFVRWHDQFLLCASPERFLARQGSRIRSQPIKGTIRRGSTPAEDAQQREQLLNDEKERAENLMIVDLVRNDLARVAQTGTVRVPELFGLYPFRHLWQMISTVEAELAAGTGLPEILRATFPMGSMTGAPKIRAMQLIEHYECTRRGLYSGSIGYVWPNGDFDFNVVIRSLQYRQDTGYLSFEVGSAITYDSDPEREYEECLLKAKALLEVLNSVIGEL
ncbi:anthranilate synthase component I family protein [Hymenobacter convexus]|uniref:anthranilate synthase component I family protein n=1 Tax=Hymenobacter sp. CA1UV-4 TaxID=3063782 RepID=UPI0027125317|nr:anthranilate synthase component I family protein [Hymenobacter sp. CA1UV-4]MDO7852336.1 anthranilate synthase component I family protein [Hymenobacter sp. CA1UV-4]